MGRERIGFSGHQGLTPHTETLVVKAIDVLLEGRTDIEGVCSLAEGADQLFAARVLAAGGTIRVIVPSEGYESTFETDAALQSFRDLLGRASSVTTLDHPEPSESAYWDAGKQVVENSDRLIAVWNGKPAGGLGGTADVVRFAQDLGKQVDVVWPEGAERR